MLAAGDVFDRFRIEQLLGTGGNGQVYRAFDPRLERQVALKILSAAMGDAPPPPSLERMLLREARAVAKVRHPNVVAVHEVGVADGVPFMVMELVVGRPLREYIGEGAIRLSLDEKIRWLVDVARALAAAHGEGIVHRDVKPDNVMVCADGTIKLLDFGIAKRPARAHDPDLAPPSFVTREGHVRGTPSYMAPEQLRGEELDARTDQYAWGLVAYELLAGVRALGTDGVVRALGDLVPDLPPQVEMAVMKALSRQRENRFDRMENVVMVIEPYATYAPPSRPSGASTSTTAQAPRARPSRRLVGGAAIVALAAAAGATAFVLAKRHGANATTTAMASPTTARSERPAPHGSPESVAAFVSGMQAFRDGSMLHARHAFERAIASDASMAASYLRLALLAAFEQPDKAREHYQRALELRTYLDDHDAALLDAAAPRIVHEPPDFDAFEKNLVAALALFPDDAELTYYLGDARVARGDDAGVIAALEPAVQRDPRFAAAYTALFVAHLDLGELDAAEKAIDRCLENRRGSSTCTNERVTLDRRRGDCARLETDARQEIAVSGNTWHG